jgi:hypothetical protein
MTREEENVLQELALSFERRAAKAQDESAYETAAIHAAAGGALRQGIEKLRALNASKEMVRGECEYCSSPSIRLGLCEKHLEEFRALKL